MAYDYNVVTTTYSTTKSTDFFDLCKLINLAISKKTFDSNIFDIIYRLLRLSSQTSQLVPRTIFETVTLTIETGIGSEQGSPDDQIHNNEMNNNKGPWQALKSGCYTNVQLQRVLRQASKMCNRERDKIFYPKKVIDFFLGPGDKHPSPISRNNSGLLH